MKFNFLNTTKLLLIISAMTFTTSGCLKQYDSSAKDYNNDNPSTLLEFVKMDDNHLATTGLLTAISVNSTPAVETVTLGYLRVASPNLPTSGISVTLKVDTTLIPSGYTALPAASYTLNTSLTTATGVRNNNIQIQLTKASLDLSKAYAIALVVSNPGTAKVNPLGNVLIVSIGVKNPYDGIYTIRGYHTRGGDATLTGPTGTFERTLATTGLSTVAWRGTVPWGFQASTLPAGYEPILNVNATTNAVTITSSNGLSTQDNSYNNRYVPASKTFYIKWGYAAAAERSFIDTLVYSRPR